MDHTPSGCATRPLSGCLVILLATVILSSVMVLAGEIVCHNEMSKFLKVYPDAEVTHVDYSFLRPKGIGRTIYYMESSADPLAVQGWYGGLMGETARERHLTRVRFSARYNEDRTATNIVIAASCIQTLPQ